MGAGDPTEESELDAVSEEPEVRSFAVASEQHGERLDRALTLWVPEFSRSYLQSLIEAGAVRVEGRVVRKPASRLLAGWRGQVELRPTQASQAFLPDPVAFETVYVDEHLRVVNKPVGLVVHPAAGHWRGTLLNGLLHADPASRELPRAGIVHRLDKDTSGLMVVARTRLAMDRLVADIASRVVAREYLALAHGTWRGDGECRVEAPIGRDPRNRLRMAVVDSIGNTGKPARTDFRLLQQGDRVVWVAARLHTGRTHQVRVHMAHMGHPLVGDALYRGEPLGGLNRQGLHAARLAFSHPADGRPLRFAATLPDDLRAAVLSLLGPQALRYNPA